MSSNLARNHEYGENVTIVDFKEKVVFGSEYESVVKRITELSDSAMVGLSRYASKIIRFLEIKDEISSDPNFEVAGYERYAMALNSKKRDIVVDLAYSKGTYLVGGKTVSSGLSPETVSAYLRMVSLEYDFFRDMDSSIRTFESVRSSLDEMEKLGNEYLGSAFNAKSVREFKESLPGMFLMTLSGLDGKKTAELRSLYESLA